MDEKCRRRAAALATLLLAVGCGREDGRPLRVAETVALGDTAAATLAWGEDGRRWLGAPGMMRVRAPGGDSTLLEIPGSAAPAVAGWMGGAAYLRAGDTVVVVPGEPDSVVAVRGGFAAAALLIDVRGRALLQGAGSGAVLAHDPLTLAPVWAWAALGSATTALAESPEGDRVYQALADSGGDARLLIRDLQTGRELGSVELPGPIEQLTAGSDGTLYGVAPDGRRAAIVALRPAKNDLELIWRRALRRDEPDAELKLALSGERLAVWGLGEEIGLRLLDAGTGAILGRTAIDPRDAAFGPAGDLWALYAGEVRRLE